MDDFIAVWYAEHLRHVTKHELRAVGGPRGGPLFDIIGDQRLRCSSVT